MNFDRANISGAPETSGNALCKAAKAVPAVRENRNTPERPATIRGRATGEQRLLFVQTVWNHITRDGMRHKAAVDLAAVEVADRCPDLIRAGKNGSSALNYTNFRTWTRALGRTAAGEIDFGNGSALIDRRAGTSARPRPGSDDFWWLFDSFYKKQAALSIPTAYKHAAAALAKLNPADEPPPLRSVRYQVERYGNRAADVYAREGEVPFTNKVGSYIDRDWSRTKPMDCWFCDCRVSDFAYRVPAPERKEGWKKVRPYMCAFSDAATLFFVGVRFGVMEDDQTVADSGHALIIKTFFDAVGRYGVPRKVYSDNGKDFLKAGFSTPITYEKNGREFSIFNELGVERHIRSIPYRGRSKTIERNFRYFSDDCDRISTVGLGNAPGKRPEISALADNKKYLPYLDKPEETTVRIADFVREFNKTPKPGSKITGGLSPAEAFAARPQRSPLDPVQLAAAFLLPLPRLYKVGRGFSVAVEGKSYFSEALQPYWDRKVIIKKNIFDPSRVFAFDPAGFFIGECRMKQSVAALAESEEERAVLKSELRRQAEEKKAARAAIDAACGQLAKLPPEVIDRMSPEQLRAARAGKLTIEMIARYQSVKGAQHVNEVYALKPAAAPAASLPPPDDSPETGSRAERLRRGLADMLSGEEEENEVPERDFFIDDQNTEKEGQDNGNERDYIDF